MSVRLLVKQKNQEGSSDKGTEVVLDEAEILLGRDKSCQVVLAEHAVSRSHAKITQDEFKDGCKKGLVQEQASKPADTTGGGQTPEQSTKP